MSANFIEPSVAETPAPTLAPVRLKAELVRRAQDLGFDACRVTSANPPPHAEEFRQWLREGAAGEMEWLHRSEEKRSEPAKVIPSARSVIVVALSYWQGDGAKGQGFARPGRIARYAWGDDYHEVMLARLRPLDAFLRRHGGEQKIYVDTGPVLERDFAAE